MIHAIVQARTGSTRLPGKVFKKLGGHPLLWHVVNRLKPSRFLNDIIVATTTNPADSEIEQWCLQNNIKCFRGSEQNVLDRYYQCATHFKSDIIVRITADDPFKDFALMDQVIEKLISENLDVACNNKPATYPEGLDIEVFTYGALKTAATMSVDAFEHEHVTQYFYRNPDKFKFGTVLNNKDLSELRWTIDTQQDYDMAATVYENLYKDGHAPFKMDNILSLLAEKPDIVKINSNVTRSFMYSKKD